MSSAINLLSPPWIAIRSQLREIIADRAEHRLLEQELADYTS